MFKLQAYLFLVGSKNDHSLIASYSKYWIISGIKYKVEFEYDYSNRLLVSHYFYNLKWQKTYYWFANGSIYLIYEIENYKLINKFYEWAINGDLVRICNLHND